MSHIHIVLKFFEKLFDWYSKMNSILPFNFFLHNSKCLLSFKFLRDRGVKFWKKRAQIHDDVCQWSFVWFFSLFPSSSIPSLSIVRKWKAASATRKLESRTSDKAPTNFLSNPIQIVPLQLFLVVWINFDRSEPQPARRERKFWRFSSSTVN